MSTPTSLTGLVAERDTLVAEHKRIADRVDEANARVEEYAYAADMDTISDADLATLHAATWGVHRVSDALRARIPFASGFGRINGGRVDALSPTFSQRDVPAHTESIAAAIVNAKAKFGSPDRRMAVRLSENAGTPERDPIIWIGATDTFEHVVAILNATTTPSGVEEIR